MCDYDLLHMLQTAMFGYHQGTSGLCTVKASCDHTKLYQTGDSRNDRFRLHQYWATTESLATLSAKDNVYLGGAPIFQHVTIGGVNVM